MNLDHAAARRIAAEAGLDKLASDSADPAHLDQLLAGLAANQTLMTQLPRDLHWSEEMALIFRLADAGGRRS